ncbi:hypothetical protein K438DRAFT_1804477 [Mycena galopus ATCC 62051]|nr:hypothetical protein K438DRAFT_1804477 [Mycena galopus ATCC 62051]
MHRSRDAFAAPTAWRARFCRWKMWVILTCGWFISASVQPTEPADSAALLVVLSRPYRVVPTSGWPSFCLVSRSMAADPAEKTIRIVLVQPRFPL